MTSSRLITSAPSRRTRRSAGRARPPRPPSGPTAGPATPVRPARRSGAPGGRMRTGSSPRPAPLRRVSSLPIEGRSRAQTPRAHTRITAGYGCSAQGEARTSGRITMTNASLIQIRRAGFRVSGKTRGLGLVLLYHDKLARVSQRAEALGYFLGPLALVGIAY